MTESLLALLQKGAQEAVDMLRLKYAAKGLLSVMLLFCVLSFLALQMATNQNEAYTCCPEFPSEHELSDASLRQAANTIRQMFFPWDETRKLIFFDDKDCDLKQAYQLLKAGDREGTASERTEPREV